MTASASVEREVAQIDPIERAALRMGAYELKYRPDVPYRVVINEAGSQPSVPAPITAIACAKNGVLDKLATHWRTAEKLICDTRGARWRAKGSVASTLRAPARSHRALVRS